MEACFATKYVPFYLTILTIFLATVRFKLNCVTHLSQSFKSELHVIRFLVFSQLRVFIAQF